MAAVKRNNWLIFLCLLVIILIILSIVLIFLLLNNKKKEKETVIIKEVIKNQTSAPVEIPIYPKDLPKYSSENYQQIGILTSNETDKEPIVLPLFGRKVGNRSDRWQYYTATDKNNMMRLPIRYENKECEDEVGCRELYSNDKISVDIYQGRIFTATIYKTESPKYFASSY